MTASRARNKSMAASKKLPLREINFLNQTMLSHPIYVSDSPAVILLPTVFWATEWVQPAYAVTTGPDIGTVHFAICQSVERLALNTACQGFSREFTERETTYNARNYAAFSELSPSDTTQAQQQLRNEAIDLLVITDLIDKPLSEAILTEWLPRLSKKGALLLAGGASAEFAPDYASFCAQLAKNGAQIDLGTDPRAILIVLNAAISEETLTLHRLLLSRLGEACLMNVRLRDEAALREKAALYDSLQQDRDILLSMVKETRIELESELQTQAKIIRERERDIAVLGEKLLSISNTVSAGRAAGPSSKPNATVISEDARAELMARLEARKQQIQQGLRAFRFSKTYRDIRKQSQQDAASISASGLFDKTWYRKKYADLRGIKDLSLHYVCFGAFEGRNPGPNFDTMHYYISYPEVADAGMNALIHYIRHGKSEGRVTASAANASQADI